MLKVVKSCNAYQMVMDTKVGVHDVWEKCIKAILIIDLIDEERLQFQVN